MKLNDIKYISEEKAIELKRSELQADDIVIIAVGSSGQALRIPQGIPKMVMSQNFNKITPDISIINPVYLEFCINSQYVQGQFKKQITDTVRTFLSLTKIISISIPVPPLPLQNQFAAIVEKVEGIKARQQESLAELERLYGSLSQRAFRGELDLSRVPVEIIAKSRDANEQIEEISIIPDEIYAQKAYTNEELRQIILSKLGNPLSFDALMDELNKDLPEQIPQYEEIKKEIYAMLEGTKPELVQTFEKNKKRIVLSKKS